MTLRTLLLCSRPPWPLTGGDRVRTWHLARALATLGPVDLVACRSHDESDEAVLAGLDFIDRHWLVPLPKLQAASQSLAAFASGRSLQEALYDCEPLRAAVREALASARVDVVVAHLVRTVPWLPDASPPVIVDIQDALSDHYRRAAGLGRGWRRLAMALERDRIARSEQAAVERADAVTFISPRDAKLVLGDRETLQAVAHPAVDLERFAPWTDAPAPFRIGFAGNLRTASNQDMATYFARELMPLVRSVHREAELHLFGVEAPAAIRRLGRLPGVRFIGPVDDMRSAIGACQLTVCPLRFGSGVQNKVLESLAVGTPAVVTPQVAEALGVGAGGGIAVARAGRSFAKEVVDLLGDGEKRKEMGTAGQAWVREQHAAEHAFADFLQLVRQLAGRGDGDERSEPISPRSSAARAG